MMRLVMVVAGIAGVAMAAGAQAPPQDNSASWPTEVRQLYNEFKSQCRNGGGKFVPDKTRFATQTEVTGDGKPDWVIDYGAWDCQVPEVLRYSENAPESGTAYCGTAGCTTVILGSGRRGLTNIFESNVRGWEAAKLAGGKTGLELSVHGSACGGVGAEVCVQTLAWNGSKWNTVKTYRWTDADYAADQQKMEANPYVEPPQHTARWQFVGEKASAMAVVTDHPEITAVGLRCMPGGGMFMTVVPRAGMAAPQAGQPLMIAFTGYTDTDTIEGNQQLMQDAGRNEFSAEVDPVVLELLAGKNDSLSLIASGDGGGEWQNLTPLSLGGSSAAIRSLKGQCTGVAGAAASQQAGGQQTVGPLNIVPGHYVEESTSCSKPVFEVVYYDGRRFGLMRGSEEENFLDALGKVSRIREGLLIEDWETVVDVMSPTRIRTMHEEFGQPMRWCPAEQIPAGYRAN